MPQSPLDHLRVVELSDGLAAARCGHELASWGADVVVVEPPEGSPLRRHSPTVVDSDGETRSMVWEHLATGKRSAVVDPAGEAFADGVRSLLDEADLLVTDWSPGRLAAAGFDLDGLQSERGDLIIVSVTPYGLDGPYAGYEATDLQVQALSSFGSQCGYPDREPLQGPANVFPYACGMTAFIGALSAVRERSESGLGQLVEVAQVETVAMFINHLRTEYTGVPLKRYGGPGWGNWRLVRCGDGDYVAMVPLRHGRTALSALRIEETSLPEQLRTNKTATVDGMHEHLEGVFSDYAAREIWAATLAAGEPAGLVRSAYGLLDDLQLTERGYFHHVETPGLGTVTHPGPGGRFSASPMPALRPAPRLGDAEAPRTALTGRAVAVTPGSAPGSGTSPPLAGVRVVDLTQAWIGPYATLLLGMLGADVIKIEAPWRPDIWRGWRGASREGAIIDGNPDAHPGNTNGNFNSVNMNKRDLTLDLASDRGREILLRLVEQADLVMENYAPRVMGNFGLDYKALSSANPALIMVSSSGFGATGPYRDFKSNGAATEANVGWDAFSGYPGEQPLQMGGMAADAICGLYMAANALVALIHRDRTGQGQAIDGSMFESGIRYIAEEIALASVAGETAERLGNRHPDMAPHGVFRCAGEDQWVAISVRDDDEYRLLCGIAPEVAALRDPRFRTLDGRLGNVEELERHVTAWTRPIEGREVVQRLQAAGIPAMQCLDTAGLLADPHIAAREWLVPLAHPDLGERRHQGPPWRFSRSSTVMRSAAPRLGEHSEQVLRAELGLGPEQIAELIEAGVTGSVVVSSDDGYSFERVREVTGISRV